MNHTCCSLGSTRALRAPQPTAAVLICTGNSLPRTQGNPVPLPQLLGSFEEKPSRSNCSLFPTFSTIQYLSDLAWASLSPPRFTSPFPSQGMGILWSTLSLYNTLSPGRAKQSQVVGNLPPWPDQCVGKHCHCHRISSRCHLFSLLLTGMWSNHGLICLKPSERCSEELWTSDLDFLTKK